VAVTLWRIFGAAPADRFFDDFFYYLEPAKNWVDGHGSTFFPGEPTNGYHPLWFLWLASLYWIAGDGSVFFGLVDLSIAALLVGFFVVFERFLQRVTGQRLAATVGAGIAAIAIAPRAMWGLEMALTVFAAAVLLCHLSRKPLADQTVADAGVAGLLAAFLVLSRLDAVMLAPGLLAAVFPRWRWRQLVAAVLGAAPLFGYLAFNMAVYGTIWTTAMAAKSLAVYVPPNWHFIADDRPFRGALEIGMIVVAIVIVVLLRSNENVDVRRIALALTAAPLLQFVAQAFMSGWGLYPWYFYFDFMAVGLAAALVVARLAQVTGRPIVAAAAVMAVIVAFPLSFSGGVRPNRDIAQVARRLQAFSSDHPGVYAMGDAAGTPAWMIDQPVVHLEGLMMSQAFVDRIRQRQPLEQVFRDYHVDYYVAVRPSGVDTNGCLEFVEPSPSQSSVRAPHLTMSICQSPVAVIGVDDHYYVRIYRVDPLSGRIV
ncbi:MAG: hypothetical protein JO191_06525, partial [Mycobacteriaceae bacterium]|nr:hypothetical protein [Mycobacteriaceae bacterium]